HRSEGERQARLGRRVRGDGGELSRRGLRPVRARSRRLLEDPGGSARRPAGRRRCGAAARTGAQRSPGLRAWGTERPRRAARGGERFRGIRPAPGYPACPDHTEKRTLFELLDVPKRAGITLTESCAMLPAASVSGWYFAHPEAKYFGLGRIGKDQVVDYAARKGMAPEEVERWLAANLGYVP